MKIYDISGDYSYDFGQWHFKTKHKRKKYFGYIRWRYGNIEIHISSNKEDLGKIIYCEEHQEFYDENKYKDIIKQELGNICSKIELKKIFKNNSNYNGGYKKDEKFIMDIDKKYPEKYNESILQFKRQLFISGVLSKMSENKKLEVDDFNIVIPPEIEYFIKMAIYDEVRGI